MAVRYDIWIPPVAFALALGGFMLLYSTNNPWLLGLIRLLSGARWRAKRKQSEPDVSTHPSDLAQVANIAATAAKQDGAQATKPGGVAAANLGKSKRFDFTCAKPVALSWQDVDWYVEDKGSGKEKHLLHFCSGKIVPGELAALMGPSGAGKSTLLNLLAMQKTRGRLDGKIECNGKPRDAKEFKLLSTYVEQEDNFFPSLSVLETVTFHAKLRQSMARSNKELNEYIEEIVGLMGLGKTLHTQVGGVLPGGIKVRGLSGGEKRRLSVICAVVKGPSLVFLDEPTSGLDSFAAIQVMKYMKGLAAVNHTVIASIHQPPQAIWNSFDKVVLMSEGHCLFSGPTPKVVPWFAGRLGYPYEPVADGPVAEWVLQLIAVGFSKAGFPGGAHATMREYADVVAAAELLRENMDTLHRLPEYRPPARGATTAGAGGGRGNLAKHASETDSVASAPLTDDMQQRSMRINTIIKRAATAQGGTFQRQSSGLGRRATVALSEMLGMGATPPIYTASWLAQFKVLYWRNWLSYVRNPADVAGRLLVSLLIGLVIGFVFWNLPDNLAALDLRLRVLSDELIISMLMPFIYMSLFAANRSYFAGEITSELYTSSAYYLAVFTASLPVTALNAIIPSLTVYGLAGLRYSADAVLGNTLILALHHICASQVFQPRPAQQDSFCTNPWTGALLPLLVGWYERHITQVAARQRGNSVSVTSAWSSITAAGFSQRYYVQSLLLQYAQGVSGRYVHCSGSTGNGCTTLPAHPVGPRGAPRRAQGALVVQLAAYIFPNQDLASAAAVAIICVCLQLAGFFFVVNNLIRPLYGISYLSFARWSYDAAVREELNDRSYPCPPVPPGINIPVSVGGQELTNVCTTPNGTITGDDVRVGLGMTTGFWECFGILVAYIVILALIGYVTLALLARSSRYAEGKPSGGGRAGAPPRMVSTLDPSDGAALQKVESGLPTSVKSLKPFASSLDPVGEDTSTHSVDGRLDAIVVDKNGIADDDVRRPLGKSLSS